MRDLHRLTKAIGVSIAAGALAVSGALSPATAQASGAAQSAEKRLGTTSLAAVLAADGTKFDGNPFDFDILEAAVVAVLGAKPNSPVKLLTQGRKRATAFLPTDQAFRFLVRDLVGYKPKTEVKTFDKIVKLVDIDTIEAILLYHVVPGATLTSHKVLAARGSNITTANGATFKVVLRKHQIILRDQDPNSFNARAFRGKLDINRGNRQVAHGISRVLRPIDL